MVSQKSEPTFGRLGIARRSSHPAGNGSFGNVEAQHQEFTVNAGRAPSRVLGHHAKDQISNFFRDSSPTNHSAGLGDGTPVECESRSMPADHGLRSHDEESLLPSGPEPSGQDPEELIECSESWPRVPAFQCRELLAKSQVFKKQAATTGRGERSLPPGAEWHLSCAGAIAIRLWRATPILLKSQAARVLARHRGSPPLTSPPNGSNRGRIASGFASFLMT